MKVLQTALAVAGISSIANAAAVRDELTVEVLEAYVKARALPNAPRGYTPASVDCPSNAPTVRLANELSANETAWLERRRNNTVQPMRDFLSRMNITGFDAGTYIDRHQNNASALPNIGLAFSGGGWRALLNGAGVLKAFDSRTMNSTNTGQLGGLLQSSTYIAGLSGGNWLVGSVYANNFSSVEALQRDTSGQVWEFGNGILKGPDTGGIQLLSTAEYYGDLLSDVDGKRGAGYEVSLTDYWGRGLSFQLINATNGGPSYTFSSIALTDGFKDASQPFPIVIADGRAPGTTIVSSNSTIYEFNPFEMGTWDPTAYGFVPTQYIGTNLTNGEVTQGDQCVVGFDNLGFVLGTSSTIFNALILQFNNTDLDVPSALQDAVQSILTAIGDSENDIAPYSPNPFYRWRPEENYNANTTSLTLVDGGEDLQNIPFNPLIQPIRHVDVIFANDNSADTTNNWPNGTAILATYERQQNPIGNGTGFPYIPDQNTFVNLGLNNRPTFFGCDASNITTSGGQSSADVPLIVYLPNSPYVTYSNQATVTFQTNDTYRDAMIANGYEVATMGNGTVEATWPQCVACAVLSRSFTRTGTEVPQACTDCFNRFCWNGTVDSSTPPEYNPSPILGELNLASSATSLFSSQSYGRAAVVSTLFVAAALI